MGDYAPAEPGPTLRPDRWVRAWRNLRFPLLVALLVLLLQVLPGPYAFDDAHITYRYARNLTRGLGFVYNPGERVLGTTTPLYTLLLALASWVSSSDQLPLLSIGLNAVFDLGAALLMVRLLHSLGATLTAARILSLAYLLSPLRVRVALGGMETSMAVFWLLAAGYLYAARKQAVWAAACSGLACLTRPDFVLLPALLAVFESVRLWRIPWKPAAAFAAVIAPWLAFSWLYFGNPLPQSIIAKSSAYFLHPYQASVDLLAYLGTRSRSILRSWSLAAIAVSAILMAWLYLVGCIRAVQQNRRALPLTLLSPLYALALAVANPLLFSWYYLPLILLLGSFQGIGVFRLLEAARPRVQALGIGLAAVALLALEWTGLGGLTGWRESLHGREELYATVAETVRPVLEPGGTIGLPEIGVLGYAFGDHTVVDTVGLVTPAAVPFLLKHPAPGQAFTYAISDKVIAELKPDYLITLEVFVRPTLLQSEGFHASYRLIREFETGALDSVGLLVYERIASDGGD